MRRSACKKISLCAAILALLTAQNGVCAEQAAAMPGVAEVASPPAESLKKVAKKGSDEILISLKAPLFSPLFEGFPLARVNDDTITIAELTRNLDTLHSKVTSQEETGHKKSFTDLLDRLISVKLVVEEARRMELDQQSEVKSLLAVNRRLFLKQALYAELLKEVKPNEKEVERVYAELRREVKLLQVEFGQEAAAQKFVKQLREGKKFDDLADKAVTARLATRSKSDSYLQVSTFSPEYQKVLERLKIGEVSRVVKNPPKFVVLRLEGMKNSDDLTLKDKARAQVLAAAQGKVLDAEKERLFKKYLRQNSKLIKGLDLQAKKPGIDKLLTDKRVLVSAPGETPITVADLVNDIRSSYTHGMERAIQEKKINQQIAPTLKNLMTVIVLKKEALARGLDKTPSYREKVSLDEESTLFGAFVEFALKPEIKIEQKDLQAYFDSHRAEFSRPETLKLKSLAFKSKDSAQRAIEKLRKGIDLKWLASNADNLLEPGSPGMLEYDEREVPMPSLPQGVQKALVEVKSEEYRLYESPEGYHYVLFVEKAVPARQQTLIEAANEIVPAAYGAKFKRLMDDWTKKLRDAADVAIYANF